ncbi:MAG: large conductance mechanosensitive channel protein MscL [Ruminococcaceae bacterium]|nr:large conductance mechanosensitive channel protein MscL [Oscillospiraceae bacterium]
MGKADMEHLQARIEAAEQAQRKDKAKKMRKELKAKKDGFFKDFKKFITRGNVLDMAVGVIVGGAFTAIINALSNNILKPVINWILALIVGTDSLSEVFTYLKVVYAADGTIDLAQSIYIDWGAFINAIINFLLIAFTLFVIVRTINNVRKRLDAKELAQAAAKAKAEEEKKKAEEAAKAEAAAAAAKAEADRLAAFFANVEKQTKLLEELAKK